MSLEIKPFAKLIAMTQEKLDKTLAPIRARAVKAKATVVCAELEEKLVDLERKIHEACATKEIDFDQVDEMQFSISGGDFPSPVSAWVAGGGAQLSTVGGRPCGGGRASPGGQR